MRWKVETPEEREKRRDQQSAVWQLKFAVWPKLIGDHVVLFEWYEWRYDWRKGITYARLEGYDGPGHVMHVDTYVDPKGIRGWG